MSTRYIYVELISQQQQEQLAWQWITHSPTQICSYACMCVCVCLYVDAYLYLYVARQW